MIPKLSTVLGNKIMSESHKKQSSKASLSLERYIDKGYRFKSKLSLFSIAYCVLTVLSTKLPTNFGSFVIVQIHNGRRG